MATKRYLDLLQQGFMKPAKKPKKPKGPIVACEKCLDWHEKGKHRKTPSSAVAQKSQGEAMKTPSETPPETPSPRPHAGR